MEEGRTIGIICEGPTDDVVLRRVISTALSDPDIQFRALQPLPGEDGNWDKVLKYCAGEDFKGLFTTTDVPVVIQIDTDFLIGDSCPEEYRVPHIDQMVPAEILEEARNMLIAKMGSAHYEAYASRIIFAVAVHQTECWFLGIYHDKNSAKASKVTGCIGELNRVLPDKEGFYIDAKDLKNYHKLCKHFRKKSDLEKYSQPNESFAAFVQELTQKLPAQDMQTDAATEVT